MDECHGRRTKCQSPRTLSWTHVYALRAQLFGGPQSDGNHPRWNRRRDFLNAAAVQAGRSAATLQDAIGHYAEDAFDDSPGPNRPNFAVEMLAVQATGQAVYHPADDLRVLHANHNLDSAQSTLEQAWCDHGTSVDREGHLCETPTPAQAELNPVRPLDEPHVALRSETRTTPAQRQRRSDAIAAC